jgi:hypothetical protein
MTKDKLGK